MIICFCLKLKRLLMLFCNVQATDGFGGNDWWQSSTFCFLELAFMP